MEIDHQAKRGLTLVTLYLSGKLTSHPRAPKGAVGCIFAFTNKTDAMSVSETPSLLEVEVLEANLKAVSIDAVRAKIIANSHLELADVKKKKKKPEEKEDKLDG